VAEVDADLMGAAGVEVAQDEGGSEVVSPREQVVVGDGGAPGAGVEDCHLLPVDRVTSDVGEDGAGRFRGNAGGGGEVEFGGLAPGELVGEGLVGEVGLGGHEAARGVLVEAVDDPGALDAADAAEASPAVVKESVDEGAVRITGRRVNDKAPRLVDHDEVIVFVKDVQGDVAGEDFAWLGRRQAHRNPVAGSNAGAGPGRRVIEEDVTRFQESLDAGTAQFGEFPGEKDIKTISGRFLNGDLHGDAWCVVRGRAC